MGCADERPLSAHLLNPSPKELPETAHRFDLPEYRLNHCLAPGVHGSTVLCRQLTRHPLFDALVSWAIGWALLSLLLRFIVLLPLGRDESLHPELSGFDHVLLGEIPCVRCEML